LSYEPTEITYRSLSYYLEDTVAKKLQPGAQPSAPSQFAADNSAPAQSLSVVKTAAATPSPAPVPSTAKNMNAPVPALPKAVPSANTNVTLSAPTNAVSTGAPNPAAVIKVDDAPPPPSNAPKAPVKPVSGGVLNGRALNLPVPEYPMAARNAHASGLVTIEVIVDVTGRVKIGRAHV